VPIEKVSGYFVLGYLLLISDLQLMMLFVITIFDRERTLGVRLFFSSP
jgi:hypothetical protein